MDRDRGGKKLLCCTYVLFLPLYCTYVLLFPLDVHQRFWDVLWHYHYELIGIEYRLGFAVKLHQRGNSHESVPQHASPVSTSVGCDIGMPPEVSDVPCRMYVNLSEEHIHHAALSAVVVLQGEQESRPSP